MDRTVVKEVGTSRVLLDVPDFMKQVVVGGDFYAGAGNQERFVVTEIAALAPVDSDDRAMLVYVRKPA